MTQTDVLVPAHYYERLFELLSGYGVSEVDLGRNLGLPKMAMMRPGTLIRFSQVDQLITRASKLARRSDLGFDFGRMLSTSSHSFVGFRMLHSETLDEALRFQAKYFRLLLPSFRMRYVRGENFAEMHLSPAVAMSHACLAFHLEAVGMASLREIQDLAGQLGPACHLYLSIPEPAHARRYAEFRDLRVSFAADMAPTVRLRILTDPCTIALPTPDRHARELAEARCRTLVQQVTDVRQFATWVAMTLREVSEGIPSVPELASMLNISSRTLNRYLEREGTSYRELSGRIQHELARERLALPGTSITEVAYSLGFADSSTFARAFREVERCSPTDYRNRKATRARRKTI